MKFGPVDSHTAVGAILAHSVQLADGSRLRKGRALDAEDVAALRDSGLDKVTVARLDADDVHEDAAAAALAQAFVPDPAAQGFSLTQAFTGRVNLLASGPGVVEMDVAAIEAVNRVHPMITIATVPPFHQMAAGGMVATIKMISYAVPRTALEQACALARAALRLRGPEVTRVGMIISEIDGGAGDKGWKATADRVAAFGLEMDAPVLVPHRVDALAEVLRGTAYDLTLLLTGSATSDIDDVAPSAVRAAGGTVNRFGMPVDPGNLLFAGTLHARPVIGLPGCARSPALNGADWVMARMICGVPVTDADIAGMGVGGLLKEIPSRPHPRRRAKGSD
jgi:molybdenum cofactor cytidylyltransferase